MFFLPILVLLFFVEETSQSDTSEVQTPDRSRKNVRQSLPSSDYIVGDKSITEEINKVSRRKWCFIFKF